VKHGNTESFEGFVRGLLAERRTDTNSRFWRQQDVAAVAARWADEVGPDRIHLVTVPPSGAPSTLLWERFCAVLGVDPAAYDASAGQTSNFSLPYSDAELLRKINKRLDNALSSDAYNRYVRKFLANEIMRPAPLTEGSAPPAPDTPTLGPAVHAWATERAEEAVAALASSGINIVGDLRELVPPPYQGDPEAGPSTPPRVVYPETAVRVMVQLLRKITEVDPEVGESAAAPAMDAPRRRSGPRRRRGAGQRAGGAAQ
jgi:hypothetical protein